MMSRNMRLILILSALFYLPLPRAVNAQDGSVGNSANKLLALINEGRFNTPEGNLILYRGVGSTDGEMGGGTAQSGPELYKWLHPGGLKAGMAADNDREAKSFTVSLAYAGRYTGVQAWGRDRGVIKLEIPVNKIRGMKLLSGRRNELPPGSWVLMYDTPASVYSAGKDVYDGLPFMGTAFRGEGGEPRSICPPADNMGGNCPAFEIRLSIGDLKKLGTALSVSRVTWEEYDAARKELLENKAAIMKADGSYNEAAVRKAEKLWKSESGLYSMLCDAGAGVCPERGGGRDSLCEALLALPGSHYLFRQEEGSPANEMMIALIGKKAGGAFKGGTLAEVAEECRSGHY